ncbi:hypothetical protein ACMFMG_007823 [Clarireedia jacksonii]
MGIDISFNSSSTSFPHLHLHLHLHLHTVPGTQFSASPIIDRGIRKNTRTATLRPKGLSIVNMNATPQADPSHLLDEVGSPTTRENIFKTGRNKTITTKHKKTANTKIKREDNSLTTMPGIEAYPHHQHNNNNNAQGPLIKIKNLAITENFDDAASDADADLDITAFFAAQRRSMEHEYQQRRRKMQPGYDSAADNNEVRISIPVGLACGLKGRMFAD